MSARSSNLPSILVYVVVMFLSFVVFTGGILFVKNWNQMDAKVDQLSDNKAFSPLTWVLWACGFDRAEIEARAENALSLSEDDILEFEYMIEEHNELMQEVMAAETEEEREDAMRALQEHAESYEEMPGFGF